MKDLWPNGNQFKYNGKMEKLLKLRPFGHLQVSLWHIFIKRIEML